MRSIESYIREVILNEQDDGSLADQAADAAQSASARAQAAAAEARATGEEIFDDTTADVREIWSKMGDYWSSIESKISGEAAELEGQARDIADEATTIARTGMTRNMLQLLENEALLLKPDRLEKIKKDVEAQLAQESEAGVVISDNDLVNFRHGIRMMLLRDYADPPLTYPYRTAIYISAHRRNIETVTELVFDTLNYGMRAFLALPSLGKSIGLRKPAGGDPDATTSAAEYAKYAAYGAGGTLLLKLGAEAGLHVGLEKVVKWFIQKGINPQVFRNRVRSVLINSDAWNSLVKTIEGGVSTRESASDIIPQFVNYLRAYEQGVNYETFIKSFKEAKRLSKVFGAPPVRPTITFRVFEPTLTGTGARAKFLGKFQIDPNIIDDFTNPEEVDDFIREFSRRVLLKRLGSADVTAGSLDQYVSKGEIQVIMSDTDYGPINPKFVEFAKVLDIFQTQKEDGIVEAIGARIRSVIGDNQYSPATGESSIDIVPGLRFIPAKTGDDPIKPITNEFTLSPEGLELPTLTTDIQQGAKGMASAAEALVTPTYTLTMLGQVMKLGRRTAIVTGTALTAALAAGGLAKFVEVGLLDSGDGIAYVPAALASSAAAIRKDAFESFQETLDLEPDIDVLGLQTNVAGGNVNEGIFAQADEILLRLLEEPIGSDTLDLGPDRMKKAADLYAEALRLTLEEWSVLSSSTLSGLAIGAAASLYLGPTSVITGAASRAAMLRAAGISGAIGGFETIADTPRFSSLYVDSDDDQMPDFLDSDPDGDGDEDVSAEEIKKRLEALPDDFAVTRSQMKENRRLSLADTRSAGDHVLRSLIKEIFRQSR